MERPHVPALLRSGALSRRLGFAGFTDRTSGEAESEARVARAAAEEGLRQAEERMRQAMDEAEKAGAAAARSKEEAERADAAAAASPISSSV